MAHFSYFFISFYTYKKVICELCLRVRKSTHYYISHKNVVNGMRVFPVHYAAQYY